MAKRFFNRMAVALLALSLWPAASVSAQCLTPPGDINADGQTDVGDIQCAIITSLVGMDPQFPDYPSCLKVDPVVADSNCDNTINISDLILLVSYAIELPLSPLVDSDASGCPDACEVAGQSLTVPASITGTSSGSTYMLDSLGTGFQASGSSTGGGFTLAPKAVGLTGN